jgi:hypothetical protein
VAVGRLLVDLQYGWRVARNRSKDYAETTQYATMDKNERARRARWFQP